MGSRATAVVAAGIEDEPGRIGSGGRDESGDLE